MPFVGVVEQILGYKIFALAFEANWVSIAVQGC